MVTIKHEIPVERKGKSVEEPPTANSSRASSVTLPLESDDEDYDDRGMGLGGLRAQDNDIQQARQFFQGQQNEENHHHNLKRKSLDNAYGDVITTREQEYKTTLMRRGHSEDVATNMARDIVQAEMQDYNMRLLLLEQQNKKRLMMARNEQDDAIVKAKEVKTPVLRQSHEISTAAEELGYYEFQLLLLEFQNKKRLRMARNQCDDDGSERAQCEERKDWYETQLRIIELLNERRLAIQSKTENTGVVQDTFGLYGLQRENEIFEKARQDLRCLIQKQVLKPRNVQQGAGPDRQPFYRATQDLDGSFEDDLPGSPSFKAQNVAVTEDATPKYPNFEPCFNRALVDYQIQLMLLELQNRERLLQSRVEQDANSFENPASNKIRDYQQELALLDQATQSRKSYDHFIRKRPYSIQPSAFKTHPINPEIGTPAPSDYDAIQAYTTHIMLANLQNRLKLLAVQPTAHVNHYGPPLPPPPPTCLLASLNPAASQALREYQSQILSLPLDQLPPLDNLTIHQLKIHEEIQKKLQALGDVPYPDNFQHPASGPNRNGQDYWMMLMLLEQQNKLVQKLKERIVNPAASAPSPDNDKAGNSFVARENCLIHPVESETKPALPSNWGPGSAASVNHQGIFGPTTPQNFQGFQTKLAVKREQQQQIQHCMYGVPVAINQNSGIAIHPQYATGNHALQDYQMQLMLLEQQKKKKDMLVAQVQENARIAPQLPMTSHALTDYQMQLLLLEQQNKKRLMMARQGRHSSAAGESSKAPENQATQELQAPRSGEGQRQLAPLEQQNKQRLIMERQELHHSKPSPKISKAPKTHLGKPYSSSEHFQALQQSMEKAGCQTQIAYQDPHAETTKESTIPAEGRGSLQYMGFQSIMNRPSTSSYYQGGPTNSHTLQDYEAQLDLLNLQNKERAMMTTRCQEPENGTGESSTAVDPAQLREVQQEIGAVKARKRNLGPPVDDDFYEFNPDEEHEEEL
ncbi:hypothetical protein B0J14DRAFT_341800 [Halenospora varia]|nr:hypothetical protein B0J14DRAFT_341800 [Halenospora varia]